MSSLDDSSVLASDAALLRQAQQGSADSFGRLAERYRPQLLRLLSRRPPAGLEAEDLAQETLARAFAAIDSCDPARPFGAWLNGIALNVAATQGRRRREVAAELVERADDRPGPAQRAAIRSDGQSLWALAEQLLKPRQFEALQLRYARQLGVRDIAAAMRITKVHVKVLLFRARQALLKSPRFVESHGFDDHRPSGSIES